MSSKVVIVPLSPQQREIPAKWRGQHPPVFPGDEPTDRQVRMAIDAWRELDPESQAWYGLDFPERLASRYGVSLEIDR